MSGPGRTRRAVTLPAGAEERAAEVRAARARAKALKAQVRATLATISDDAYNEYLDLRSLEETREEVAGTPSPKSRDWLTDDDESAAQDASVERLPCLRGPRKEQPRCVRRAPPLRR